MRETCVREKNMYVRNMYERSELLRVLLRRLQQQSPFSETTDGFLLTN